MKIYCALGVKPLIVRVDRSIELPISANVDVFRSQGRRLAKKLYQRLPSTTLRCLIVELVRLCPNFREI